MKRPVLAMAVAACAVAWLAGCAPTPEPTATAPHTVSRPSSSPTPSSAPTPTKAPLPADVLFQITVTATASDGATARLTETVHAPVTATNNQTADEAELDNECDGWRGAFTTTKYVVAEVSTAVTSGSWNSNDVIAADMAGYPVWTGDQRPFQAYCATALPYIPGAARAVSPVGGGAPDSDGGWGIYRYGFSVPTEPSAGATPAPAPTDLVLSNCSVQLGAAAKGSAFASSWPGTAQTNQSCVFGGA